MVSTRKVSARGSAEAGSAEARSAEAEADEAKGEEVPVPGRHGLDLGEGARRLPTGPEPAGGGKPEMPGGLVGHRDDRGDKGGGAEGEQGGREAEKLVAGPNA